MGRRVLVGRPGADDTERDVGRLVAGEIANEEPERHICHVLKLDDEPDSGEVGPGDAAFQGAGDGNLSQIKGSGEMPPADAD